MMFVEGITVDV